jgi:hypothetical protein
MKRQKEKKKGVKKLKEIPADRIPEEPQDRFDFGGLPKRDLKKNLGCG